MLEVGGVGRQGRVGWGDDAELPDGGKAVSPSRHIRNPPIKVDLPIHLTMAEHALSAFIAAVRLDSALQQQLSTTAAADADEVAAIARAAGFAVHPNDLVAHADGALVEYSDEDFFMKPRWWELNP